VSSTGFPYVSFPVALAINSTTRADSGMIVVPGGGEVGSASRGASYHIAGTLLAGLILGAYHSGLFCRSISTISTLSPEALAAILAR